MGIALKGKEGGREGEREGRVIKRVIVCETEEELERSDLDEGNVYSISGEGQGKTEEGRKCGREGRRPYLAPPLW